MLQTDILKNTNLNGKEEVKMQVRLLSVSSSLKQTKLLLALPRYFKIHHNAGGQPLEESFMRQLGDFKKNEILLAWYIFSVVHRS